MTVTAVLTVVAHDRPGIVRSVAAAIAAEDGNWIDSSLARLGGEFAGIVRVDVARSRLSGLEARLARLAHEGVLVSVRTTGRAAPAGRRARLSLTSVDQPGIVHEISDVLARLAISIERFDSKVEPGSMSGAPLFVATADLILPPVLPLLTAQDAIEALAGDLMADLVLRTDGAPEPAADAAPATVAEPEMSG